MSIEIRELDPSSAEGTALVNDLDEYLLGLYPEDSNHLDSVEELSEPHVHFLGAFEDKHPLGCGAVKLLDAGYGEIKRVYVKSSARGKGVGRGILLALENIAADAGYSVLRLETGIYQPQAVRLFEASGYVKIDHFGDYPSDDPLSIFMEKKI